ncbi:hypothetical protein [Sutcliffiella rhizosphaerae]|uniref:hypothetical protein n=1 Tax=Sutcliffiella rhizosphaerae TaxID=2880967 RepID=UPI001E46B740|nr:hypothetical protein [Sutcliffiella rhizosphaerae]
MIYGFLTALFYFLRVIHGWNFREELHELVQGIGGWLEGSWAGGAKYENRLGDSWEFLRKMVKFTPIQP